MSVRLGNGNWAVSSSKLLAYNDAAGPFFNKEFDFTRNSSATNIGKSGLIELVDNNIARIYQNILAIFSKINWLLRKDKQC